jgi:hypothetical protein
LVLSLLRLITGPELWSRFTAVMDDCLRRPANCVARFDRRRMRPGDFPIATASLMAPWLAFRVTIDSGSSNGGGNSASRPRRPSGDACTEELFVVSRAVSGDMMGEFWREPDVAADEALMAEAGWGEAEPAGGKEVWTWLGLRGWRVDGGAG